MAINEGAVAHVIYDLSSPIREDWVGREGQANEYFKRIGLTYERAEPNSHQEVWHLYGVRGLPTPLPKWFTIP